MPPSHERLKSPGCLTFFIRPRSFPSEKISLPSKTISWTFAFGPSSMTKESCCPDPPMFFASCLTVAKGRPFWASISLMIASTLRAFAGS